MAYLTQAQKGEVIKDCGDSALILYDFYISKGNIPDYAYSDAKSAKALVWNVSKSKRIRLVLEKAGYLRKVRDHNTIITYIGKENVKASLNEA